MAQDPLHVLWIEPHFPGRLGAVADWLVRRRGYRSTFYCHKVEPRENWPASVGQGLDVQVFDLGGIAREQAVSWSRTLERSLCYSYGCWEVLEKKRPRAIDLVVGRSMGLGSSLFAPVVRAGGARGQLSGLLLSRPPTRPGRRGRARYVPGLFSMAALDGRDRPARPGAGALGWVPTSWQRGLYPAEYRDGFLVLHDGIDTRRFSRGRQAPVVRGCDRWPAGRFRPRRESSASWPARWTAFAVWTDFSLGRRLDAV